MVGKEKKYMEKHNGKFALEIKKENLSVLFFIK